MLAKQHRLASGRDFRAVFTGGTTYTHRLLVLKVLPRRDDRPSRFGFSASAKLGAVAKNRAKRVLREAVRLLCGRLQQSGYDAVLIARPPMVKTGLAEVMRVVEGLFRKAGRLGVGERAEGNRPGG